MHNRSHKALLMIPVRLGRWFSTGGRGVRLLKSESTDPLFNLATEEWLFRDVSLDRPCLFLWRNASTVVIGRNQNAFTECNIQVMEERNVTLSRRGSGGGAVYQDLGNTCFTFLSSTDVYDKTKNTNMLVGALKRVGVASAEPSGRNDITVDGRKVSGSAFRQSGPRAFHHGTLLIDVDMSLMAQVLNVNKAKLESKGVKSVRSRVLNLKDQFPDISHESLSDALRDQFFDEYEASCEPELLTVDQLKNNAQVNQYYQQLLDWDWRFGKNPQFTHRLEHRFDWGLFDVRLEVEQGRVTDVALFSDCLDTELVELIRGVLRPGLSYDLAAIDSARDQALALATAADTASKDSVQQQQQTDQLLQFFQWLRNAI